MNEHGSPRKATPITQGSPQPAPPQTPAEGSLLCRGGEHRRQPNSRGCFICGLGNPLGLKMVFYEDAASGRVRADLTVPDVFRSYPGVVHGGIVATILDETSGRALMLHTGDINTFFVTAKMEMRYRRATPTNTPLVAVGWVERMSQARARVKGELCLQDGTVLAQCDSLVVHPQSEFLDRWDEEIPYWRVYSDEELDDAGLSIGRLSLDNNRGPAL
jgi:acyl-coenzyme A thioesterase PaaI-like protein